MTDHDGATGWSSNWEDSAPTAPLNLEKASFGDIDHEAEGHPAVAPAQVPATVPATALVPSAPASYPAAAPEPPAAPTPNVEPVSHQWAAPQPVSVAQGVQPAPAPAPDTELVSCPECGTKSTVTLNRRQADDFCRNCDFPLFWTPSVVVLDRGGLSEASLRRMPGTEGLARTASVPCPHCSEPNTVTAQVCVRCGLSMHVAAPPPPPEPVYVAPPPPPPDAPPPKKTPWWVWLLLGVFCAAVITVVVLFATGTIG
jgi:hypothetical protein